LFLFGWIVYLILGGRQYLLWRRLLMAVQSREKWAGRFKWLGCKVNQKFSRLTYRYKRTTAGRGQMLTGKMQEARGKLREKLARVRIRIIP
jgi:hypothetical protein